MSNSYLTVDMVTREALRVAHESCAFIGTINRDFDESFKGDPKIGATLRIRKPNQYAVRTSGRVMDVQDQSEATTSVTVGTQYGVDMRFHSDELALSIEDFSTRYVEPAVKVLVSQVENACLAAATKATYNTVGAAGTVVGTSGDVSAFFNARARLNQMLAPKDANRAAQIDSVTMATMANGLKALFLPQADVAKAFREGFYARTAAADLYENERTWTLTNSSDVTAASNAAAGVTDGGVLLKFYTDQAITLQTVGEVFTISGVYACHPETKASLGYLQQFTVITADPGTSGTTISPSTTLTGAKQNVCTAAGATLLTTDFDSKTLVFIGSASTAYRQNLMYHKDAFTFVTADLPLMADSESCARRTQDGISLRVWKGADIVNDRLLMRIDLLWGFASIRPEWACRITN